MTDEEPLPSTAIWLKREGSFPAPDWNWLIDWQEWADALCARGGGGYEVISSAIFSPCPDGGIAEPRAIPKYVAILFQDDDVFLEYISIFYSEEEEFGHPGGLFIPDGLGHFVLPIRFPEHRAYWNDARRAERVADGPTHHSLQATRLISSRRLLPLPNLKRSFADVFLVENGFRDISPPLQLSDREGDGVVLLQINPQGLHLLTVHIEDLDG